MLPHRLFAASLLASACVLPAAAQSPNRLLSDAPATPSTLNLTNTTPGSFQLKASPKDFDALVLHPSTQPPGLQPQPKELALLKPDATPPSQTNQPCAKLRSYNFTPKDLKSPHPHASSETDCTPASAGHLKTIPATSPATLDPK